MKEQMQLIVCLCERLVVVLLQADAIVFKFRKYDV